MKQHHRMNALGRAFLATLWLSAFLGMKAQATTGVGYALIGTAHSSGAQEAMVVSGGGWLTRRHLVHNAVLIRHPKGDLLLDTGLGRAIHEQFAVNSWFDQTLFAFEEVRPAADQLAAQHYDFSRLMAIVPTHLHWDHVSGLKDFPNIPVWTTRAEYEFAMTQGKAPEFLRSQYDGDQIPWQFVQLEERSHMGFRQSLDVFGDGSVVLVGLSGHSPGQLGLILTLDSGKELFFIGDTTWTLEGIQNLKPRPDFVHWVADVDWKLDANDTQIQAIHALANRRPKMVIVPAHDENVAKALSHYPEFEF